MKFQESGATTPRRASGAIKSVLDADREAKMGFTQR
jgi:hypothetical protein